MQEISITSSPTLNLKHYKSQMHLKIPSISALKIKNGHHEN
jgi:hypothetical protein